MEGQAPEPARRDIPWTLILFGVLSLYAILIIFLNRGEVEIHFVVFSTRISKIVLILLCLGLGFAAGFLADRIRERLRRPSA